MNSILVPECLPCSGAISRSSTAKMIMKKLALVLCTLTVIGASFSFAHGVPQRVRVAEAPPEFEWVDLTKCAVPRVRPPAKPAESDEEYGFERRFLAIGPGLSCVLMETYVEALSGSYSSGMQVLGSRYYRVSRGKWHPVRMPFLYFPYGVRRKSDGQQFFVQAVLEQDVGVKYPGASGRNPGVFIRQTDPSKRERTPDSWDFERYSGPQGAVLQGLAVVLHERLRAGLLTSGSEIQDGVERKRIRFLLEAAWQTLAPNERVKVDADGMPR